MANSVNYYEILNIPKTATELEIKKAYRKLAHQYHPDKATGDSTKFKEISEAYQCLSDANRRSSYDKFGAISNIDFSGFEEAMERSGVMAGFAGKRDQQAVKISALIEQTVTQAAAQNSKRITSQLAKELAQRVLNIIYGDEMGI